MPRIGIMQGRLLPPQDGRIQSFPTGRWAEEFALAVAVPLDAIEWIYEVQGAEENPLGTRAGIERLGALAREHQVAVRSVCADYFMDRPFLRVTEVERAKSEHVLTWLLHQCQLAGISRMVLPFVDVSRIADDAEQAVVVQLLRRVMPTLEATGVELHLETDLAPSAFAELLSASEHPKVFANYDSGNSASLGYDPTEEFAAYGSRIGSIHIKDRRRGGGTVPLGTGDADFEALFAAVRRIGYNGDFILQVARDTAGQEVAWARQNCRFVEQWFAQ